MLGRVYFDRHPIMIDQLQDLVELALKQVGSKGMGSAAPELNVIIPERCGIGKSLFEGQTLVRTGKKPVLHGSLLS